MDGHAIGNGIGECGTARKKRAARKARTPKRGRIKKSRSDAPKEKQKPSRFAVRVLDPEPKAGILKEARTVLAKAFPVFAGMQVAERWAGLLDVTVFADRPELVRLRDTLDAVLAELDKQRTALDERERESVA